MPTEKSLAHAILNSSKSNAPRGEQEPIPVYCRISALYGSSEEKSRAIATSIQSQLLRLNSEFANYVPPKYQIPQAALAPTDDSEYFPIGVKHRYTRKLNPN